MEDDLNGRRPQKKTTVMAKQPQWKSTQIQENLMKDKLSGR